MHENSRGKNNRPHRVLTDPAKGEDGRRRSARLSLPEKAETQLHG
jgi:hypothetical protein